MKLISIAALILTLGSVGQARQLQGVAKVYQEQIAAQLQVSQSRVKAWPGGHFKVYASGMGASDSQRDEDVLCAGQMEMIQQAMVVGNLTDCMDAVAQWKADKED